MANLINNTNLISYVGTSRGAGREIIQEIHQSSDLPVQISWSCSVITGSTSKLIGQNSDPLESFLPSICKDLIDSALDTLEQTDEEEESLAQSLLETLFTIHSGVTAMTEAYEQAEESLENGKLHFVNQAVFWISFSIFTIHCQHNVSFN